MLWSKWGRFFYWALKNSNKKKQFTNKFTTIEIAPVFFYNSSFVAVWDFFMIIFACLSKVSFWLLLPLCTGILKTLDVTHRVPQQQVLFMMCCFYWEKHKSMKWDQTSAMQGAGLFHPKNFYSRTFSPKTVISVVTLFQSNYHPWNIASKVLFDLGKISLQILLP